MNQFHHEIHNFPSKPSQEFLEKIFILNQENIPEVGSLSSIDYLRQLIQLSSYQFYIAKEEEIIGFIICFKENSSYDSLNYKFFSDTESKFLYIDRIAIKDSFRREGIGKSFYNYIEQIATEEKIYLCCEINTTPLNQPSMQFHKKLGFKQVGHKSFNDHAVAYFIKKNK